MDFSAIPLDAPLPKLSFGNHSARSVSLEFFDSDGKVTQKITDPETLRNWEVIKRATTVPEGFRDFVSNKDKYYAIHYLVSRFLHCTPGYADKKDYSFRQLITDQRFNLTEAAELAARLGKFAARQEKVVLTARIADFAIWFAETQELEDVHWVRELMTFFYVYRRAMSLAVPPPNLAPSSVSNGNPVSSPSKLEEDETPSAKSAEKGVAPTSENQYDDADVTAWPTLTDAAKVVVEEMKPKIVKFETVKSRISRLCDSGEIESKHVGRFRRVAPHTVQFMIGVLTGEDCIEENEID